MSCAEEQKKLKLTELPHLVWRNIAEKFDTFDIEENLLRLSNASPELQDVVTVDLGISRERLIGGKAFSVLTTHSYLNRDDLLNCGKISLEAGGYVADAIWQLEKHTQTCPLVRLGNLEEIDRFMHQVSYKENPWEIFLKNRFSLHFDNESSPFCFSGVRKFVKKFRKFIVWLDINCHGSEEGRITELICSLPKLHSLRLQGENHIHRIEAYRMDRTKEKLFAYDGCGKCLPENRFLERMASRVGALDDFAEDVDYDDISFEQLELLKLTFRRNSFSSTNQQSFFSDNGLRGFRNARKLLLEYRHSFNDSAFRQLCAKFGRVREIQLTVDAELRGSEVCPHDRRVSLSRVENLTLFWTLDCISFDFIVCFPFLKRLNLTLNRSASWFYSAVDAERSRTSGKNESSIKFYQFIENRGLARSDIWRKLSHLHTLTLKRVVQISRNSCNAKYKMLTQIYTRMQNKSIQFQEVFESCPKEMIL